MSPVQLFHTCLVNEFAPEVGFAVVRVLERLGFHVQVPLAQTCCGQPALNAGFHDDARTAARHTIEVLEATEGPVVIPSGSCGDMVIHQFAELLASEPDWQSRARAVASRCGEFSAFVAAHVDTGAAVGRLQTTVAYHPSCHLLRGLGVNREPHDVLAAIDGVREVEVTAQEECCGFGGLFSIKHADISSRLLERKIGHVSAAGADRLVSCDLGCLLHIGGGMHRRGSSMRVQHIAELLDESLPALDPRTPAPRRPQHLRT